VDKHYLFINHALDLNDILIAALRLKFVDSRFYLARFIPERVLKRTPYKVMMNGQQVSLIPDGFLDLHKRRQGASSLALPVLLEHDRGTEEQQHFKRRIRAYRAFLLAGAYKQLFGVENVTVAFTTFIGSKRVAQMREWTRQELASEPNIAARFLFAELPRPPEPVHLLFEPRWYTLVNDQPIALLSD
ncbi:MAG: replication-relaxation family protein, partial [Ktedonobacteraceae bacterium]